MPSIWYHSHQSLLLALYLQQQWGASRPKCHHAGRTARIHSFFAPLFALQSTHWLLTSTNARTKMSAQKKKHMSYINVSIKCFKVYIPTIHLLWTCLNTHYLCLKSSHPSQSSAPVAVPHQLQKSATSHHQRSCRGDHLLLWKKSTTISGASIPHVTYRFREQKYRTSVVICCDGSIVVLKMFHFFPTREFCHDIFVSNGNRTKKVDESFSHQSQARMDA